MLRLTMLGALDLRDRHGHAIRDVLSQPKRFALLAYLAVEGAGSAVSRDRLLALFWPESDAARARNSLSQALHALRQGMGGDVIESQGANTVGIRADNLWSDTTAFVEAVERKESDLALDLYRGEFCPTLFIAGAPQVEQWLDNQRNRFRRLALSAGRTHAVRLVENGDFSGATRTARRTLAMRPDDESDVRALLTVLDQAGDAAGALLAYQEYERRLAAELETTPAAETRRLVQAMRLRREPAPVASTVELAAPQPRESHPRPSDAAAAVTGNRRSPVMLATLALALLMVVGVPVLRSRLRSGAPAAATSADRRLAVFPFALRGGPRLAYLREGMVDLLAAKLDGASGFQTIDPRTVLAAVERDSGITLNPDVSGRIARELGAGWYVSGDVVEIAGRLQLSGGLYDARGGSQAAAKATVSGDTTALFELVDDLAGRILAGLTSGRDTALTRLAAVTTHSLPALKAFLQGEQALRVGRDAQGASAFRDAATLDTTFALAQYRLALSVTWTSIPGIDPAAWAAMAARHAQRLTPLIRDLLTAFVAYRAAYADEAERMYLGVTQRHPDNVEAWFMLGETRFHFNPGAGRSPAESRGPFERVLALDPANSHAMIHLARLAALDGRVNDLDSLAHRYLERYRDADRIVEMQGLQAFLRGDSAQWSEVGANALRAGSLVSSSVLQSAVFYAQNFDAAEVLAPVMVRGMSDPVSRRVARRELSDLALGAGRWGSGPRARSPGLEIEGDWVLEGQALLASDPFFPVERPVVSALRDRIKRRRPYTALTPVTNGTSAPELGGVMQTYLVALLSIRLGDTVEAARYVAELAAVRDPTSASRAQELSQALGAELARTRGDAAGALAGLDRFPFKFLSDGSRSVAHWGVRERFLRAELLHTLGRDEEALGWYESLEYEVIYLAASQFRQGEIYQRVGNVERARFHYGRFVNLWKNCDPEFRPMVDRALAFIHSEDVRPSPSSAARPRPLSSRPIAP